MSFPTIVWWLCYALYKLFGYPRSKDTASVFGYQNIVFYANATAVAIMLKFIITDKFGKMVGCFPAIDKGRDKITSRLDGEYKSGLKFSGKPKCIQTKLG